MISDKDKIIYMNCIIARFMGIKPDRKNHAVEKWYVNGQHLNVDELKYHENFDNWLLPAWKRLYERYKDKAGWRPDDFRAMFVDDMKTALVNADYQAAHLVLYKAIVWENEMG